MTKRKPGAFPISINELYNTPPEAIDVLIPFLRQAGIKTFAEPCVGEGHLADYLVSQGFQCVAWGDISYDPPMDARHWHEDQYRIVDAVITNPPWSDKLMQAIIRAQTQHVPGWFLVKSDWLFTKQSGDLMFSHCTDIVPIGRVKWFPETKGPGFDNCCWVRMTRYKQSDDVVTFHPLFDVTK